MPKCWLHAPIVDGEKPSKPLKEHPGFPDTVKNNYQQNLGILFTPKKALPNIRPHRHWEWTNLRKTIGKEQQNQIKDLGQEKTKLLTEINQWQINYQHLNQKKQKDEQKLRGEKQEINNKLNQLITRVLNISEKPTGTFDPELKKQKGVKELLERYSVNNLDELVKFIDKAVERSKKPETNLELSQNYQELLNKIELLKIKKWREREEPSLDEFRNWIIENKDNLKRFYDENILKVFIEILEQNKKYLSIKNKELAIEIPDGETADDIFPEYIFSIFDAYLRDTGRLT